MFDGSILFVPCRARLCGSYAARGRLEEAVNLLEHARAMYVAVPVGYLREDTALVAPRIALRYPCARSQEGSQCMERERSWGRGECAGVVGGEGKGVLLRRTGA